MPNDEGNTCKDVDLADAPLNRLLKTCAHAIQRDGPEDALDVRMKCISSVFNDKEQINEFVIGTEYSVSSFVCEDTASALQEAVKAFDVSVRGPVDALDVIVFSCGECNECKGGYRLFTSSVEECDGAADSINAMVAAYQRGTFVGCPAPGTQQPTTAVVTTLTAAETTTTATVPTTEAAPTAGPTTTAAPIYYELRGAGMTGALISKQTKEDDVEACKAKCTAEATCLSISFKASSSRCRLSSKSAGGANLNQDASFEAFEKIAQKATTTAAAASTTAPPYATCNGAVEPAACGPLAELCGSVDGNKVIMHPGATPQSVDVACPLTCGTCNHSSSTATTTMSAALEVACKPLHGQEEGDATADVLQAASGSCSAVADRINAIMTACPQIRGKYNERKGATCSDTAEGGSNMLVWAKNSLNKKANLALDAFYKTAGTKRVFLEKKPKRGSVTEKLLAAHRENKKGAKCKAIAKSLNAMLADANFKCAA